MAGCLGMLHCGAPAWRALQLGHNLDARVRINMKILLWVSALLLAALWTGSIALCASAAHWLANTGGQVVGAVQQVAEWPVPDWAVFWIDPAGLDALRAALTWSIDFLVASAPWVFSIVAWVAPLLWALWALGMLLLALLVGLAWVLLCRVPPPAALPQPR